jgi:hypothetical protein
MTEYTENDEELWKEFQALVRENELEVVFLKKDGTERTMNCTLMKEAYAGYKFEYGQTEFDPAADKQTVWDLDKNAWRMIKKGTILSCLIR